MKILQVVVLLLAGAAAIGGPKVFYSVGPQDDHAEQCGWTPPSDSQRQKVVGDENESLRSKAPQFFQ